MTRRILSAVRLNERLHLREAGLVFLIETALSVTLVHLLRLVYLLQVESANGHVLRITCCFCYQAVHLSRHAPK